MVDEFAQAREEMVEMQLRRRGIRSETVLEAMRRVPRHAFVPQGQRHVAYADSALPIGSGQTISQPYMVAAMSEALELSSGARVLEVGTGSGYAAAVLGRLASEVYTVERHLELAETAEARLREEDFENVHVRQGDGTMGWAEHAPYDAIVVAAGGKEVPKPLLQQLAVGGRLVIPVGRDRTMQKLRRVRRITEDQYEEESLGDVRFVPLIGTGGWEEDRPWDGTVSRENRSSAEIAQLIGESAEPFSDIDSCPLESLLDRVGDARLVLIGEATHGTSRINSTNGSGSTKPLLYVHCSQRKFADIPSPILSP